VSLLIIKREFIMNNGLSVFEYESKEVRFVNGFPVANDVAMVLGYKSPADAVYRIVDQEYKGVCKSQTPGGKQNITILKEPGIYQLIFSSKLESADRFRSWVFEEVLPSIRKTGGYGVTQPSQGFTNLQAYLESVANLSPAAQKEFIKSHGAIAKERERTKQEALKTKRAEIELEETKILQVKKKRQYDRTILKVSSDRQELKDKILEKINRLPSQSISSREVIQAFRRNKINNRAIDTAIVLDLFAELESEGFGRLIERRFILSEAYGEFEQLAIATCH
jgi:prophage antirepressor-like protein